MGKDARLKAATKIIPGNATYTWSERADLGSSFLCSSKKSIVEKVNTSPYITILVDGTRDRNGEECLSIAARYTFEGKLYESIVGLEYCSDLTAKGVSAVIIEFFQCHGINTDLILSQCYDGAHVMSEHIGRRSENSARPLQAPNTIRALFLPSSSFGGRTCGQERERRWNVLRSNHVHLQVLPALQNQKLVCRNCFEKADRHAMGRPLPINSRHSWKLYGHLSLS